MSADSPQIAAALKRFEGLHPKTIDLSLGRILGALERMGRPQDRLPPVIHIAGTNGKGSTTAFLRAMAEAAGHSAHVFTSPHLVRFNERIRLAGTLIDDEALLDCLERTFAALDSQPITHFEATTAAAMLAFSETPADFLILEVGLGGRFDATNVIDTPAISVITPIDRDHSQFLGNDLAGIAGEKAGIIKPNCPVVSAAQNPICAEVITQVARERNAALQFVSAADEAILPDTISLVGPYQRQNAALAAKSLKTLNHIEISDTSICKGAQEAVWPARMQRLSDGPIKALGNGAEVWLDGGHNPHAALAIANHLASLPGTTHLVCAMMASKDHAGYLKPFSEVVDEVHTAPNSAGHENISPAQLSEIAAEIFPKTQAHSTLETALIAAAAGKPDRILIGGSLYLSGDVLQANFECPT